MVLVGCLAGPLARALAAPGPRLQHDRPVFLVAKPGLGDPNFNETVVLVFFPPGGGPVGVILNRPMSLTVNEAFRNERSLREWSEPMFFGGPVQGDTLVFLFRRGMPPERGLRVAGDLYLSGDRGVLEELRARPPQRAPRFFLGVSGWSHDQLDTEIAKGAWYTLRDDIDAILRMDPRTMWKALLDRVGGPVV